MNPCEGPQPGEESLPSEWSSDFWAPRALGRVPPNTSQTCLVRAARGSFLSMMYLFIVSCLTAHVILHFHRCHVESQSRTLKVSLAARCFDAFHYIGREAILTYQLFTSWFILQDELTSVLPQKKNWFDVCFFSGLSQSEQPVTARYELILC